MKRYILAAAVFAALFQAFRFAGAKEEAPAPPPPAVYFSKDISPATLKAAYKKLGFKPSGKLGVKTHFGEDGNENYIPPALLKALVKELKGAFVETNTLYGGSRGDTKSHLAMGFGSPSGKKAQHSGMFPRLRSSKCVRCGLCMRECPVGAINSDLTVDESKCTGCGKCGEICPFKAIEAAPHSTGGVVFQEKIAEYAKGVSAGRKMTYINLAMNISAACDCRAGAPKPFMGDVGILASNDPVALDQASFDLVNKAAGLDDAFKHEHGVSGEPCLAYAEKIGLGTRKYKLVEIK